jgi:hypothetical protein
LACSHEPGSVVSHEVAVARIGFRRRENNPAPCIQPPLPNILGTIGVINAEVRGTHYDILPVRRGARQLATAKACLTRDTRRGTELEALTIRAMSQRRRPPFQASATG